MEHIETIELDSSQASITFSSIPQDYDDLKILVSVRGSRAATDDVMDIQFNASSSNFSSIRLVGDGSGANSKNFTSNRIAVTVAASATANTFSNNSIYISSYTVSKSKYVSMDNVYENNGTRTIQEIFALLWDDTSPINSFTFTMDNGNFVEGSTVSLYGITAGGDGTVTTS